MSRNAGSAPAGSRVQATQRDGNKTQANPDWDSMAARSVTGELEYIVYMLIWLCREQTWNIIDKLGEIAKANKKNVAQTAIR